LRADHSQLWTALTAGANFLRKIRPHAALGVAPYKLLALLLGRGPIGQRLYHRRRLLAEYGNPVHPLAELTSAGCARAATP